MSQTLPPESLVRVDLDDLGPITWTCTPADLGQLVTGWLVCEGVVDSLDEIEALEVGDHAAPYAARARVSLAPAALERLARVRARDPGALLSSADRSGALEAAPRLKPLGAGNRALLSDRGRLATLFQQMFGAATVRAAVGGVHTGGLAVGGQLVRVVEDVSRHHVVDRLVGAAVEGEDDLEETILLLSARISGAMAAKACRAGATAMVTRSVPTELAVHVARASGLTLVGRARREEPMYFWPPGRADP